MSVASEVKLTFLRQWLEHVREALDEDDPSPHVRGYLTAVTTIAEILETETDVSE